MAESRPYRPRKPPLAEEVDYDDEMGVIVLRTHDVTVADALARPLLTYYRIDPDEQPEGVPVYVKRVPFCPSGCSGHDFYWLREPTRTRGYTPAVEQARARLVVCGNAHDTDDARQLLAALGLDTLPRPRPQAGSGRSAMPNTRARGRPR